MFQGPETGFNTLGEAKAAGKSGESDHKAVAQEAFTSLAKFFPVPSISQAAN